MPDVKTYHRPQSVEEALRLLVQKGQAGAILAGGTGLVSTRMSPRRNEMVCRCIVATACILTLVGCATGGEMKLNAKDLYGGYEARKVVETYLSQQLM